MFDSRMLGAVSASEKVQELPRTGVVDASVWRRLDAPYLPKPRYASPLGTLYDPMYFVGGYAIHGNPAVPPYPASHGCVRVPMWIAPMLYAENPYGETVFVY